MNVAEAIIEKQADTVSYISLNTGKIQKRSSGKIQISTTCMEENHCKFGKEDKILVYRKYNEGAYV